MKLLDRRRFLHLAAGSAAFPLLSKVTRADDYPSRPVRLLVGYAPGGATDVLARLIQSSMSERLGQQIVIENRPGAGTMSPRRLFSTQDPMATLCLPPV